MLMGVMRIRKVRMRMRQRIVPVAMAMSRTGLNREIVGVLVVRIVLVLVGMFERLMGVLMNMALADGQPNARTHQ